MSQANAAGPTTYLRGLRDRLPGMLAAWVGIGTAIGLLTVTASGPLAAVAAVIAGLMVGVPIGSALAACGGRWTESAAGAALGLVCGLAAAALARHPDARLLAAAGVGCGGVYGATFVAVFYRLPKRVFGRPVPVPVAGDR